MLEYLLMKPRFELLTKKQHWDTIQNQLFSNSLIQSETIF